MNINLECIPCILNSFIRLLKVGKFPNSAHESGMRHLLTFLSQADYTQSPPVLGRELHRMINLELNTSDPFNEIKVKYNQMMMDLYPEFENMVNNSKDPFDTAMRLAIAGNVIDFGSQHQIDVMDTINRVRNAELVIDDSQQLRENLKSAKTLLYIGDNCGEIILDKLFLEKINVHQKYFVVRDAPVINDVTKVDAEFVGINKIAKVITTGDDSPGAVWERTSSTFKQTFKKADVIIAKGQGNLEGLIDINSNIYFLLVTKCELIAQKLGATLGGFVVKRNLSKHYHKL